MKERALVAWLRRRMQRSVPADLLANISDEQLIRQYESHHRTQLELIGGKARDEGTSNSTLTGHLSMGKGQALVISRTKSNKRAGKSG